jgi:hypothetical protein
LFIPGWLWTDKPEPINGYCLNSQCEEPDVRQGFITTMENLIPNYSKQYTQTQRANLGSMFA